MSLSIMGSVNTYTKTMKLQTQWNLKQQSGDYTSHKKSLDEWISTAQETLKKSRRGLYGNQDDDEEGNKKLNNIKETGASRVVMDCPGCVMQIRGGAEKQNLDVKVSHIAELLAENIKK